MNSNDIGQLSLQNSAVVTFFKREIADEVMRYTQVGTEIGWLNDGLRVSFKKVRLAQQNKHYDKT